MISAILTIFEQGFRAMRANSRLLLVGVLVFAFPLLFVWITQSFFTAAYSNIDSVQKQRVAMLHDSLRIIMQESNSNQSLISTLLNQYAQEVKDISKIHIAEITTEGARILFSVDLAEVGTTIATDERYGSLPLSNTRGAFIYPTIIENVRTWQVFSKVENTDSTYVIFSEHSFQLIDSVMLARQQQSYLGLTAIFLFLIGLAYWLHRQEQWRTLHDELVEELKGRDLFSNVIAHEFRTPLTAIKGYASFLEESKDMAADNKRFANNIRVSAERLVLLVNDFLEVARLQSGKITVQKVVIDVRNILTQVTDDLRITAENKGLELVFVPPAEPVTLSTDVGRLVQVLTNLLSNSIKYTDAGVIEIECSKKSKNVVITIKDTGMGISAKDQRELFAPFSRVGGVDKTAITGTGLGMWITKQLVTLLGGDIEVESIKGVGTHVVVTLLE